MSISAHYPQYRLLLDEPYSFAREPGFARTIHCHDFREDSLSLKEKTWRCPVTGLVFLTPSWLNEDYNAQFEPLDSWEAQLSLWEVSKRSLDEISGSLTSAGMLTSSVANLSDPIDWDVVLTAAIIAKASLIDHDELQWALRSKFQLAEDEGFVIQVNALTDAMRRHVNWFAVQWDNIQIHVRPSGQMAVYHWADRSQINDVSKAKLIEEFFISSPGDMVGKETYFFFLPIPTMGLLIYSSHTPQRLTSKVSSAQSGSVRGHLVEIPSEERPDSPDDYRLTRAKYVGIALTKSPRMAHAIGFHRVRFGSPGTYLDSVFSLPYIPSVNPSLVQAGLLLTGRGSATATLRNPDDTADYATHDSQGRIKVTLNNDGGGVYTPFLLATDVVFPKVMATRDTTPLRITDSGGMWDPDGEAEAATEDYLQRLEIVESDDGRTEGKAVVYAKSGHLKSILLRGDCTWKVERKDDAEADWDTMTAGLARWETGEVSVEFYDSGTDDSVAFGRGSRRREAYKATLNLSDIWVRFPEVHQTNNTAFDGLTIGQAINRVLQASGFAPLAGSIPAEMDSIKLPTTPKGENWRHGTQEGDDGGQILRQLLLYPRKQLSQFRLLYDWDAATWSCEKVSKTTEEGVIWWFTPDQREALGIDGPEGAPDAEFRVEYMNRSYRVYPPEANMLRPFGMEKPGPDAVKIPGQVLTNYASLGDHDSPDYLGRAVVGTAVLAPLKDEVQIAKFGRLVYESVAHRRLMVLIQASGAEPLLLPGIRCDIRGFNTVGEMETKHTSWWLRRKTTVIDYIGGAGDIPMSTYALDEQWYLPLD